jgi:prepilin-type N-terminal cleavage/methylation domain-containing protein
MEAMSVDPSSRAGASRGGFTLVEVMIALGVLAFGLLTLAVMQLQALSHGSAGRHTTYAAAVARSYLEQVHRVPWSVLSTAQAVNDWTNPGWANAAASVSAMVDMPSGAGQAAEHAYAVAWRVTDVGVAPVCLRDVEVRVTWSEDDVATPKALTMATRRYNWGDPNC